MKELKGVAKIGDNYEATAVYSNGGEQLITMSEASFKEHNLYKFLSDKLNDEDFELVTREIEILLEAKYGEGFDEGTQETYN